MSKFRKSSCVSFSRTYSWLCIYYLFIWSNFNFWHNSKWVRFIVVIIIHSLELFKSALVSGTLLSILSVLNNAVVWMVSSRPPISKSSSLFSNPLVTVRNTPIKISIIVTCMFHSFFNSLARSRYLSFFSHSFIFILWSAGTAKSTILQVLFFFFCWLLLSLVFWLGLGDPFVCYNHYYYSLSVFHIS